MSPDHQLLDDDIRCPKCGSVDVCGCETGSQAVEMPPLPLRDRDERRISIWRLVDAWSDAEAGLDAAKIADQFEDAVDALLAEYGTAAIAQDRAARAQAEPVAWQWRKRHTWFAGKPDETSFWSEWEALQPPYMDARDLAKSDPANYEIRPLYASPTIPQAAEVPGFVLVPREPTPAMMRVGLASMWPRAAYQNAAVENVWIRMCRVGADPSTEEMTLKAIAAAPTPTASAAKAEGEAEEAARLDKHCFYCADRSDSAARHAKHLAYLWANTPRDTPRWQALYEAVERAIDAAATQPPSEADRTREGGDAVLIAALRELLWAYSALIPSFEAGKEAQEAWADRCTAARNVAEAILAACDATTSEGTSHG